ncbi:MAG: hypothetical protein DRN37_00130 [Thermoplasmata archaeon]|nr:MAG: hypothetical protein DRN37_00130 [Thermoplasmata archaeon]
MGTQEDRLKSRLKRHEGLSLEPYRDSKGYWTIGWGHRISGPTPSITLHEAEELLTQDMYRASDRFMKWKRYHCEWLDPTRSMVCVELIFWVGYHGFLLFRKMIAAIEKREYKLAALELYNSELGKKYSRRARELAELMWEGSDESREGFK